LRASLDERSDVKHIHFAMQSTFPASQGGLNAMLRPIMSLVGLGLVFTLQGAAGWSTPDTWHLTPVLAAQQVPQRPANVSDQQLQQYTQQPGMGDQIRQAIQSSGLTSDQIRARLRAAGYPENLIDQYMQQGAPGQAAPNPTQEMLRAVSALGIGAFGTVTDTLAARRDSIFLTREDSLLLDSLGFTIGFDSIPTRRDSLGYLRLDSLATFRLADRLRRPRVFGLDVFRRVTTQFNPLASGPVDPDYRLGPGDQLVLILTGDVELAYQLPVTREGFVVIPQVGQLYVASLTLDQLTDLLYARLGRVYSGVKRGASATTHFSASVSQVHVNQIFVTGEVARPGAFSLSALGTVMNALYAAGGPTEHADFRGVKVMRAGKPVATLDLYDYLLAGNARNDVRLDQGDVVFVPPVSRRVAIRGSVVRPALYDLAEGQGLRELIQMSGGLLPEAYTGRAQIERILPPEQRQPGGRDRTVLDVDLAAVLRPGAPPFRLEPDDRITIFGVSVPVRNRVVVKGDVWRPGAYQVDSGMKLTQLIAEAGGLKPDAYMERAHIVRLNPDSTRVLIPISLVGIPTQGAPDSGSRAPDRGSRAIPAGQLAFDPDLQEFDEVTVYSRTAFRPTRRIAVYGNVQHPGVFAFTDSLTLRDAVMMAGGLRDDAYLLEAEISRIPEHRTEGELARAIQVPLDSSYVFDPTGYISRPTGPVARSPRLEPYDNIFIRRVPGWELQRNVYVTGEVKFPGRYTLVRRDEKLLDVLNRAGGLTPDAYVGGAQFYRAQGRTGRVGIDLDQILKDSTYRDNIVLFAGDSLHVPQYQSVVSVEGGVNSPVTVAYVPRQGTSYYVDRAGGYSRRADKGRTYVVQPNGSVEPRSATPQPGARVVVPEVPPGEEKTNWAAILGSIATILTSALTIVLVVQRL
jgi:protein involved in polysaccharide export with SLBB domain